MNFEALKCPFCQKYTCIKNVDGQDFFRTLISVGNSREEKLTTSPECCALAKGLRIDQFEAMSEISEERFKLYARLGDIACIACEQLSPAMRRIVARQPL